MKNQIQSLFYRTRIIFASLAIGMLSIALSSCGDDNDQESLEISWDQLTRHTWQRITTDYKAVTLKFNTDNSYSMTITGNSTTKVEGTYSYTNDDYELFLEPDKLNSPIESYEVLTLDNKTLELLPIRNANPNIIGAYSAK